MKKINFSKNNGLIPAVIQEELTKDILMVGFMDSVAFEKSVQEGFVWFYSRTKKRLWKKGETSGNFLKIKKIYLDCDRDTALFSVKLLGNAACHTGNKTCFKKL